MANTQNTKLTAALSSVASSVTDVLILARNDARYGATILNDSTSPLSLLLSHTGAAGSTNRTVVVAAAVAAVPGYYEVPFGYCGQIRGYWDTLNGNARVTEFA